LALLDTPVDDNDESDVESTLANLRQALVHLPKGALVLISAQLPVGTCAKLEREFPAISFRLLAGKSPARQGD
jgi:UDP-N-acetyl-D-mannosaminuronate dehydrogenase